MRRLRIVLYFVLSAAYATGLLVSLRGAPLLPVPDPPAVTLCCALEKLDGRRILLRFSGRAAFPDGTLLSLQLRRLGEQNFRGKLETTLLAVSEGTSELTAGSFSWEEWVSTMGIYRAVVELPATQGRWQFDFDVWDDTFMSRLLEERERVEALIREVGELCLRMQLGTAARYSWDRQGVEILGDALRLQDLVEGLGRMRTHYPAALRDLATASRMMTSIAPHFFWSPEGAFGGAFDPEGGSWLPGPDGRPFSFRRMESFLEATLDVARREYKLWVVKEARRLARGARHREVRALEGNLGRIEAGIRGEARQVPVPPPPPTPPQFVKIVARHEKVREARMILEQADRLWDEIDDRQAPSLYRRLQSEFADVLDFLQARVRVGNRARAEGE